MEDEKFLKEFIEKKITRRTFLKSSAFLGGSLLFYPQVCRAMQVLSSQDDDLPDFSYDLQKPENTIYSVCLQCHTKCPIKCKFQDGILAKIDGNPYSPHTRLIHLKYQTSPEEAAQFDGKLCPKGQSAIQTYYDPYRIVKVLKRDGPRGCNRWKTVSFEQAIDELVNGGYLFRDIGEERYVEGFKDIYALRDAEISKQMAEDAKRVGRGEFSVSEFKNKYAQYLSLLIDPEHPDLGPRNNQFVFMAGRIQHGRKELAKRFTYDSFGSVNFYEHTTICEQSHHIAYKMATAEFKDGKWEPNKSHMKPDALNSEFIIYFGTGAFEANFGPTIMAEKVTQGLREGRLKIAVVDPRFSKTAAKASWWLPIKPGTDGALALAMIRWIIERERFDKKYLENANRRAAQDDNEPTWSNASYLVKIEEDGPGAFLRASEIGIGQERELVVFKNGNYLAVDPDEKDLAIEGELFVEEEVNGLKVKSALQLLKESAFSHSMEEYAQITGIDKETIEVIAEEFTAHGKKAAAEFYRGPVQHTNGYYNALAIIALNILIGNIDHKGGLSKGGGHWYEFGGKPGSRYNFKKLHPGKLTSFGPPITREKSYYEESTLFNGYPAKRPWYPLSSDVYQEIIPSAQDQYPYPLKILLLHKGTPILSTPAGDEFISILQDTEKIPLFIACDIVIGETSMYADYIFPDLTFLERWGFPHNTPDEQSKNSKVRQPSAYPLTEIVNIDGYEMPISLEAFLIAVAKKLKLSGFGKDGFAQGMDFHTPEDFYLKGVANLAYGDKENEAVPDADQREIEIFLKARRHLPKAVFDLARWQKALRDDEFRKAVYVLNRGGRYENFEKAYKGEFLAHQLKQMLSIYVEKVALTRNSMTGKRFSGIAIYEDIKDSLGKELDDESYRFHLITYKEIAGGQSRTPGNYWLTSALPENFILINVRDAQSLALKEGEYVRLVSASNPNGRIELGNGVKIEIKGKVKIVEGIRPGVIAVSWHYGHWAYGAEDVIVDGRRVRGDSRRRTGLVPNPLMRRDDNLKNVCLTDPIGASSSFFDTRVNLEKIGTTN